MIQIRNGVFETNSSSVHAMIITDAKVKPGSVVHFGIGEFGWEKEIYTTTNEKATYFYTAALCCHGNVVNKIIKTMLEPYGVRCEFDEAVFNKYGLEYGHVDHGYEAIDFVDALLSDVDMLIRFLFSDESFVVTSNDNEWDNSFIENATKVDYPHTEFMKGN